MASQTSPAPPPDQVLLALPSLRPIGYASLAMAMRPLTSDTIKSFQRAILDGGWGTEFLARGGQPGECFELWNLDQPEKVLDVARSYVSAGSDIVLTNSFGANQVMLERHGHADRARAMNRAAAALSREAAGDDALVFGSMGPSGKLVSMGEIEEIRLRDAYAEQALALVEGGADALVLETLADLAEVEIGLHALRDAVRVPFGVCMTFDAGPRKLRSMMGATPEALLEVALAGGASFVGANCGAGVEDYLAVAEVLGRDRRLPVWIKPNAGLPVLEDGRAVYRTRPDEFAAFGPRFFALGVTMLGGCCGTSPDFVRALRATVALSG
jgi:5-methyltetrahydrofolate--homocysteine methyltransferase